MSSHDDIATPVNLEDATFYVAIELSGKSWVVGVKAPGSGKVGLHVLKPSDTPALVALIERHREAAMGKSGAAVRVLCCHEAGFEGFWLARCLKTNGVETIVLDPASLLVNRKARQRRTGSSQQGVRQANSRPRPAASISSLARCLVTWSRSFGSKVRSLSLSGASDSWTVRGGRVGVGRAVIGALHSGIAGAFPTSLPESQSDRHVVQVGERGQRCPGFAEFHVRAGDLVQHPGRDQPLLSGRTQDTKENTCGVPFPLQLLHFAAKEGMPRIVNPEDSPDTGRMAGAPWPGPNMPLPTLRLPPHDDRRMARGESWWLAIPSCETSTRCTFTS